LKGGNWGLNEEGGLEIKKGGILSLKNEEVAKKSNSKYFD
jgi:hypothetical protein